MAACSCMLKGGSDITANGLVAARVCCRPCSSRDVCQPYHAAIYHKAGRQYQHERVHEPPGGFGAPPSSFRCRQIRHTKSRVPAIQKAMWHSSRRRQRRAAPQAKSKEAEDVLPALPGRRREMICCRRCHKTTQQARKEWAPNARRLRHEEEFSPLSPAQTASRYVRCRQRETLAARAHWWIQRMSESSPAPRHVANPSFRRTPPRRSTPRRHHITRRRAKKAEAACCGEQEPRAQRDRAGMRGRRRYPARRMRPAGERQAIAVKKPPMQQQRAAKIRRHTPLRRRHRSAARNSDFSAAAVQRPPSPATPGPYRHDAAAMPPCLSIAVIIYRHAGIDARRQYSRAEAQASYSHALFRGKWKPPARWRRERRGMEGRMKAG